MDGDGTRGEVATELGYLGSGGGETGGEGAFLGVGVGSGGSSRRRGCSCRNGRGVGGGGGLGRRNNRNGRRSRGWRRRDLSKREVSFAQGFDAGVAGLDLRGGERILELREGLAGAAAFGGEREPRIRLDEIDIGAAAFRVGEPEIVLRDGVAALGLGAQRHQRGAGRGRLRAEREREPEDG